MPTWIGDNGTWTNAANWSGGVPNSIGVLADIPVSSNGGTLTIGIPENMDIVVGRMFIESTGTSGVLIRGSAVDSGTGVGTLVFNNSLNGDPYAILYVQTLAGGGATVFSSASGLNMRLDDELFADIVTPGTVTRFNLDVSGSGQLYKSGAGTLELNGANSFTGGIAISGGVLQAAGDSSLGSGNIRVQNGGIFRSSGTIDNTIRTVIDGAGFFNGDGLGDGAIVAATGTTMTLTGALNHVSQGVFGFGVYDFENPQSGTIVANFSAISHHATQSGFEVNGGMLRLGSAFVAANLFTQIGGTIFIDGQGSAGALDTAGFATMINDLRLRVATIFSSSGALNLTVNGTFGFIATGGSSFGGTIEGTAGVDQLIVNSTSDANLAHLTLTNWTAGVDIIQINGNAANNNLNGSRGRETISGFDGADYISGGGGIDIINAGNGDDAVLLVGSLFTVSNSGSIVDGGSGIDTLRIFNGTVAPGSISGFEAVAINFSLDTLQLTGTQFASGLASNSVLSGNGTLQVDLVAGAQPLLFKLMTEEAGSDFKFLINGTSGADIIKANDFTINTINGGAGTDLLNGGNSGDFINGGDDADKIRGGGSADSLTGGAGADIFKYRNFADAGTGLQADIINDFLSGTDKLNFRRLDADPGTAGTQTFAFIGTNAFAGTGSAQIRYVDIGNDLRVDVDANGDGNADMSIALLGAGAGLLFASDFLL